MALQCTARFYTLFSHSEQSCSRGTQSTSAASWVFRNHNARMDSLLRIECLCPLSVIFFKFPLTDGHGGHWKHRIRSSKSTTEPKADEESNGTEENSNGTNLDDDIMDKEERLDWRRKIREVMNKYPNVEGEDDLFERKKKMEKLLADYPLVVEEEDPNWSDDADGRGFRLDDFFNHISIKNVKKDQVDENDDGDDDIVWKDDDYIRPIKDISSAEWEVTVFKDISPLIILVHNRYRRPKENEKLREELEKSVHIIWNCGLPSPRCVAIDAVIETGLASALKVSAFPELIFTRAGKILYREKAIRTADEFSKIMAFFYFGAAKPPCLTDLDRYSEEEAIPTFPINSY